ncbi:MAG: hypothetical protein AB8B85_11760, partial [Paracoccaceae bacterium]
ILLIRAEPTPIWVLVFYPTVGAVLANIASRTSPLTKDIARVETSVIAAAAIFVLACLVNLLLIELLVTEIRAGLTVRQPASQRWSLVVLSAVSVLLWWALERRLTRMRESAAQELLRKSEGKITARDDHQLSPRHTDEQLRNHSR